MAEAGVNNSAFAICLNDPLKFAQTSPYETQFSISHAARAGKALRKTQTELWPLIFDENRHCLADTIRQ
jgi:hypothetical protein